MKCHLRQGWQRKAHSYEEARTCSVQPGALAAAQILFDFVQKIVYLRIKYKNLCVGF